MTMFDMTLVVVVEENRPYHDTIRYYRRV